MRVWSKFKLLTEAMPSLATRKCWHHCYQCKRPWPDTGTTFIHMVFAGQTTGATHRYVCDDCEAEITK